MSLLPPEVRQFVIVGAQLKEDLEQHELFNKYFENRKDQLKLLENVDKFAVEDFPDLTQTLFVLKHFDFDPSVKHNKQDGDNNNHIHIGNSSSIMQMVEEQSEVGSVGYTTDYDDVDDEPMQTDSDYDGGHSFSLLIRHKCCIVGSIALIQLIRQNKTVEQPILMVRGDRPLHNLAMQNILITFSGIPSKHEAQQLLTLTRYMGAMSRKDVTSKTTHLVAGDTRGHKYMQALELGLSIMNTNWVRASYRSAQNDVEFNAGKPEMMENYKLKPFHGLSLAFVGFKEEDVHELVELTIANEGNMAAPDSFSCTHVVVDAISGVDDTSGQSMPDINPINAYVVYREWFWASLEMEGKANEEAYAVPGHKPHNRRSSKGRRASSAVGYNSFSNVLSPMLDYSRSPGTLASEREQSVSEPVAALDLNNLTARHRASLELLQTERNYVKILDTIVKLFKIPLENSDITDPILPANDVKTIFGNLTPIYEVHKRVLSNLETLIEADWKETNCIGKVFVAHSIDLLKAYPPFVNFFEGTKNTINSCDAKYPRFHAFLRRCQSRQECNRESLTEMLIRPVQRLPSISLIITELIKRTDESNPDKKYLMEALESIKRVMNLVNEGKRKTEGQIAMFDIVNNIEDCPPDLLSAKREFICKAEARLLFMNSESEVIPSKSHKVVLFLFSDLIEICKIRSIRRSHSTRGSRTYVPIRRGINSTQAAKLSNKKEHRHLDELLLCDIKNIYKSCQSPEMSDAFVLEARPSARYDQNFRYYPFIIDDPSISQTNFIERLEDYMCTLVDYVPATTSISNEVIDFGYANSLVNSMEKSRLSRVLSIRQSLLSPSMKSHRSTLHLNGNHANN